MRALNRESELYNLNNRLPDGSYALAIILLPTPIPSLYHPYTLSNILCTPFIPYTQCTSFLASYPQYYLPTDILLRVSLGSFFIIGLLIPL